jgi:hypothetical protein
MKHIKLFEDLEDSEIEQVKMIIDENQYISDKEVTDEKLISSDNWIIYISQQTLDHINSHMAPSIELGDAPGSYYTNDWKKGVENVISKYEPMVGENPPFRTAWTGLDAGVEVGYVTIGYDEKLKLGDISEYKSYTYDRPIRGEMVPETIIVKEETADKTNFITIVGSKIGEVNGKGLISLWTTYPDFKDGRIEGKEIPMNRNEFGQNGFYFKASREFYEKIPTTYNENYKLKHLKAFESLPRQQTVDQWNKLRKMTKGVDIGDRISDMNKQGANIQYIQNPVDSGIESYEDFEKHNKKFVSSWNLKGKLSPFAGEDKKKNK